MRFMVPLRIVLGLAALAYGACVDGLAFWMLGVLLVGTPPFGSPLTRTAPVATPQPHPRMTKLDQLASGYLNGEGKLDASRTITFLAEAEALADPFADATVAYAEHVVQVWRPSWMNDIDWDDLAA